MYRVGSIFLYRQVTYSNSGQQLRQLEGRIANKTAVTFTGAPSIYFVMWYPLIGLFAMIFMSMFSSEAADLSNKI